jgi:GMP synthase (glutamine-hydrolysing)
MSKIIVIDFGAQYTMLIARRVRELGVYSEIVPHSIGLDKLLELKPDALILSGGPADVDDFDAPDFDTSILRQGIPALGLCYGMQLIAKTFGGVTEKLDKGEYGLTNITLVDSSFLFFDLTKNFRAPSPCSKVRAGSPALKHSPISNKSLESFNVWMSHRVSVTKAPADFVVTSHSTVNPNVITSIESAKLKIFGVQWHPEVKHSEFGRQVFENFLFNICGFEKDWNIGNIIDQEVTKIRETVGDNKVVLGLSGGVDSSVAAALIHKAIGDNLICIFVDNGLLREGEREQVEKDFAEEFGIRLITADVGAEFIGALQGVTEPEQKRKIIGEKFIRVFEAEIRKLPDQVDFLAQGTLYPDVVESGGGASASNIKSHHNVGGLPDDMKLKLVEPLRDLFKDEVRAIGIQLGISPKIINRQPFPGPSLGIRIIGEVNPENIRIVRAADAIVRSELTEAELDNEIWQCPVVLLANVRSVGVQGDERTYGHPIVLRPVESDDAMTADWFKLDYDVLGKISRRITNEVREVNRVVLDVTSKPPGTIEWE